MLTQFVFSCLQCTPKHTSLSTDSYGPAVNTSLEAYQRYT